ncbi:MAG: tetratricopeptide repeat protein [Proteobacteria bacterium]|nr:tetratricopeptide repeat protein [Pseudomonadota bacterium]
MDHNPLSLELVPIDGAPPADPSAAADAADHAGSPADPNGPLTRADPAANPAPTSPPVAAQAPAATHARAAPADKAAGPITRAGAPTGITVEEDTSRPIVGAMPPLPTDLPESQDPHFVNAVSEYRNGVVDRMLWQKALAQNGGDAAAALPLYLRNRAIALRMLRRDSAGGAARSAPPAARSPARPPSQKAASEVLFNPPEAPRSASRMPLIAAVAGAVVVVAGVVGYFMMSGGQGDASLNSAVPVKARAAPAPAAPVEAETKGKVDPAAVAQLRDKVAGLKAQRNWNVFTLYASEWTRLEPNNPVAWNQLSLGYQALHQWEDAIETAQKAATMAGTDGALWRDVGTILLQQNRYDAAREAFARAAEINGSDTVSLVRMGVIDVAYSRYADAKTVLDRALLANPVDLNVQCLKGLIAKRQSAPPDILAASRRQIVVDESCLGAMDAYDALAAPAAAAASVAVPVPPPAAPAQAAVPAPPPPR